MATAASELFVRVDADISGFDRGMDTVERRSGGASKALGLLKGAVLGAGLAVAGGFAAAVKVGFGSLVEHENALAQTNAVLKSTGGVAGVTADHILSMADSIEKLTGVDDVAIQQGQNLLLTFTGIRNEVGKGNDIFDQATSIMTDMSVALGQDMKSSAIQLGKALNDPIKGVTALQRVGVSFTQAQRDQIKTLVESGKTMEAQKLILAELTKEFGGSAKAAGETLSGRLNILKARLEEVAEKVAGKLLPVFETLVSWVESHWPQIQATIEGVFDAIKTAIDTVMPIIKGVVETFAALVSGDWSAAWEAFKGVVADTATLIFDIAKSVGAAIWDGIKAGTSGIVNWLSEKTGDLVEAVSKKVTNAYNAAKSFGGKVLTGVKDGISDLVDWLRGKIEDGVQAVRDKFDAAYTAATNFGKRVFNGVKDGITGIADRVGEFFTDIIERVGSFFVDVYNKAKSLGGKVKSGVVDGVTGVVNDVGGFISDIPGKIEGFFTDVYNAAKNLGGKILSGIGDALSSLGSKMVGWVKTPVNAVISAWNNTGLPSFKIHIPLPGPVPDIDFSTPSITLPDIPLLGDGGIVSKPTLAMIGERGPEAVVPLSRGGAAGLGTTVVVNVHGSVQTERDLVDAIQRGLALKSRRSGALFSSTPGVAA